MPVVLTIATLLLSAAGVLWRFKEHMPKNDRGELDRKALAEDWQRTRNVLG